MSQVRKLLETPTLKFQSGGKFWKNNVLVGEGEDVYKQLANYLAGTKFDDVRDYANDFLQQYSTGKEFHTSGNYSNYVPTGRNENWAKEGTPTGKFWGASFNTDKSRYYKFNQLLNGFNYVAPEKKEGKTPEDTRDYIDTSELSLDYNPTKNKKSIWSTTAIQNKDAVQRVSDIIAALKDPDNATKRLKDKSLANWLNGMDNPNAYAEQMWKDLQAEDWDKNANLENYRDWLRAAGIIIPGVTAAGSNGGTSSGINSNSVESEVKPKIGDIVTREDGSKVKYTGTGEDGKEIWEAVEEPAVETPTVQTDTTPRNIRLITPGERTDMDWGVDYEGTPYSYQYIQSMPGSELYNLMAEITANNAKAQGMNERFTFNNGKLAMPSIEGYADWTVGNTLEDGTNLNDYFLPLGVTSAAIKQLYTDGNGTRYFKYYNNYDPSWGFTDAEHPESSITWENQPWNMRRPFYFYIDKDGNIKSSTKAPEELEPDVVIENKAPVFKALPWNPASSYQSGNIWTPTSNFGTTPKIINTNSPGTLVKSLNSNGHTINVYLTKEGKLYVQGNIKDREVSSAELASLLKKYQTRKHASGGAIDTKKINALVAKNGGKVRKAQNPNGTVFGKRGPIDFSMDEEFDYFAPYAIQQEDPVYGKNGVLSIASQQTGNPNAGNLNAVKSKDSTTSLTSTDRVIPPKTIVGGDPVDPMPFWRDFSGNMLDAGRFISSAYFSDKIRKNRIKTAYEAIKKPTTALLHGYSTATPVEDAQIAQISSLIGNVKHATTSNNAVTEALNQYDWANLLPQLNQVLRYKSQRADAINRENVGVANQQSQMDANAWNDFMNQYRGARMIEGQANEDHMRNIAESLQNVLLQERAKLSQSIDKFADFDFRQKIQNNTNLSEGQLNTLYVESGARAAYNADPDKNNYVDIADWIDSSPKGAPFKTSLRKQIDEINEGLQIANRDAYIKTKIPYGHQRLYGKSGGKISVKSKNRYKNEPWEDIWINSNKAAHSAAAKLSDNIIKTFLKTLK